MNTSETNTTAAVMDHELIARYLQGDNKAFDQLYERHKRPLYSYLLQLTREHNANTDDLYQQTWLKALDALANYHNQEKFLSWLLRIAHNLAMDQFRRQRFVDDSVDATAVADALAAPGTDSAWQHQADAEELRQAVAQAVTELVPEQQQVLQLRQQEIPFKDIAAIQGCSINTVLGRMHSAVQNLRRRLASHTQ